MLAYWFQIRFHMTPKEGKRGSLKSRFYYI